MITFVAETGSTNTDLIVKLGSGHYVPEGCWFVADRQKAGRGRHRRQWSDGAGNFMGSCVVHPRHGDPAPSSLALLAGLVLHEIIAPIVPSILLKWPNDVLVGTAKLAGVLLEREGEAVIVGIGVNLAHAPKLPDRETIALASLATSPDRDAFAQLLARQFDLELERWRNFGLAPIIARWLAVAHPIGARLIADGWEGTFAGLTPDGSLQLRLADGALRTIHAGEVNLTD